MRVVVVESPAKAKTINKYLGKDYTVLASFGHVRDLPAKDGSVRPDDDFSMDWETDERSEKHLREIARALKDADTLLLATDPDREGEAISWHVREILESRKHLKDKTVRRITFNAITKRAVEEAIAAPRDLDRPLVEAYLARRALDYLVGFNLSPVLWRKLPGSRSAGRVQSVALRLICEREQEIEAFRARDYWTVDAVLQSGKGEAFRAQLTHLKGVKLDRFALGTEDEALAAVRAVEAAALEVLSVEPKQARRNPYAPFTTSTLQQEASRKLGFSARQTMTVAQKLYEGIDLGGETVGLITYMRTDGVSIAPEAIHQARQVIGSEYGPAYVPDQPRLYKTKAKNAQEAHEAIRPTDLSRKPAQVARYLTAEQARLYELVWKRTIASQMASAVLDQVAVDVGDRGESVRLRATGSVIRFDGFLRVYREDIDDRTDDGDDENRLLPPLVAGESVGRESVLANKHTTQPPPRYTEASLVKKLEELGIGRPSTYASIISVLQDRSYVRLESKRFMPEDRGRLVTAFLENFFNRYVQYSFTADLENRLDEISAGTLGWKTVLRDFWVDFHAAIEETAHLRVSEVLDALDAELGPHLFPPREDGTDPRVCPKCREGRLSLRIGKFGAFVGCSGYPECGFTRPLVSKGDDGGEALGDDGTKVLGTDPLDGLEVTLRKGPYGFYIQKGEAVKADKAAGVKAVKPPRASIPAGVDMTTIDLGTGLKLLSLPRDIGEHPETRQMVSAGIGRFGPYLKHGDVYKSLPKDDPLLVLTIGLNHAVSTLAEPGRGGGRARAPARSLGEHPETGKPVTVHSGRFGPYVQTGTLRATIPAAEAEDMESLSLERALELLAARAEKEAAGGTRKKAPAKTAAKSATAKKTAAKTTTKTAATKKAAPKKAATSADGADGDAGAAPAKKTAAKKATTAKAGTKAATTKKAAASKAAAGADADGASPADDA
ncbi:type I DNA topoisomerase [Phaeovibrio sulfidiphilus]|uniref:DNA topoisomerase 1 n=1 Tax=Phaeovibrio sulfidiphilus TaxID=1220600 RepID=A0A8J6YM55_9PROT|nr:type I DNA topoisomerase [Phaeovibrio sulfidiphilus]MBE1236369.1 type I DNA topoisomerase [Phaeovibrio sulfidiphilus]